MEIQKSTLHVYMNGDKNILIGIPVKNCGEWIEETIQQIINIEYDKSKISIAFVENDSTDYSYAALQYCIGKHLSKHPYRSIKLEKKDIGFDLPHTSRHDFRHMEKRMNSLRIIRNHIVDTYLQDNDFLWWVDADYKYIPPTLLSEIIEFNGDVVMPRVEVLGTNYDGVSYTLIRNKYLYMKELASYVNDNFFEMELIECAAIISRKIFDAGIRYNSGLVPDETGKEHYMQEGPFFAHCVKQKGFKLYGALKLVIEHQAINGTFLFDPINKNEI